MGKHSFSTFAMIALCFGCSAQVEGLADTAALDATDDVSSARDALAERIDAARRERCNGIDDDRDGRVDEGCPLRVSNEPGAQVNPSLSGSVVAWDCNGAVCFRELPNGEHRRLTISCSGPVVSGRRIACYRSSPSAFLVTDLEQTQVWTVVPTGTVQGGYTFRGSVVAWTQGESAPEENTEVYAHNIETNRRTRFPNEPAIQTTPRIEGNQIAWWDDRRGHHTIGLLHLADLYIAPIDDPSAERALTQRMGTQQFGTIASFNGGRLLFQEYQLDPNNYWRDRSCRPMLLDIATGERRALGEESSTCEVGLTMSGRWAVLETDPLGPSDLLLVDTQSSRRLQVTRHPRRSTAARLDGNTLVWADDRNEEWKLYWMDLTDLEAGDFYPEGLVP